MTLLITVISNTRLIYKHLCLMILNMLQNHTCGLIKRKWKRVLCAFFRRVCYSFGYQTWRPYALFDPVMIIKHLLMSDEHQTCLRRTVAPLVLVVGILFVFLGSKRRECSKKKSESWTAVLVHSNATDGDIKIVGTVSDSFGSKTFQTGKGIFFGDVSLWGAAKMRNPGNVINL